MSVNPKYLTLIVIIGFLSAIALLGFYPRSSQQTMQIVSIDIAQVIKKQSQWLLQSDLNEDDRLTIATYLSQHLTALLDTTAKQQHLIFLNQAAILAGADDISDELLVHQRQKFEQLSTVLNEANNENRLD